VEVAGRVIRGLEERRIEVLEVGQQSLVQGYQAVLLDQLRDGVLAGDDDVVRGTARVQLGQQLVVAGVKGLVDGHPGLRLGRQLPELRERRGVVVLRPVVDLQMVLEGLAGQGVRRTARAARRGAGLRRRRASARRREQRHPAQAEGLPPGKRSASRALYLAVQIVELRLCRARRENIELIVICVHYSSCSPSVRPGAASPRSSAEVSSQLRAIRSPG